MVCFNHIESDQQVQRLAELILGAVRGSGRRQLLSADLPVARMNLSVLVYLNGWEIARENLVSSNYLGLGLNRMGCNGNFAGVFGDAIEQLSGSRLNFNDGSFLVSKVVSELGVLGIAVVAWLSSFVLYKLYRIKGRDLDDPQMAMAFCFATAATVAFFTRSAGYFDVVLLYALLGVIGLSSQDRYQSSGRSETD